MRRNGGEAGAAAAVAPAVAGCDRADRGAAGRVDDDHARRAAAALGDLELDRGRLLRRLKARRSGRPLIVLWPSCRGRPSVL